ncbi:MAG: hypothetical protein ACK55I_03035, partial [bacterium]
FTADQLTFHEELAVERAECFDIHEAPGRLACGIERFLGQLHNLMANISGGSRDEREAGDIASESNATGDDDVGFGPVSAQPLAAGCGQPAQPGFVINGLGIQHGTSLRKRPL